MLWPLTVLPAKFGGGSLPLHTRLPTIVMPPPMFNPPAPVVLFWKSALRSEPVQFGEAPAVESLILSRRRPSTYQSKWRAKFFELDQGLTIRWRVQQTALAPKFIQATIKTKWRTRSEIALEDFTVVADLLSNVVSPFGIKAEVQVQFTFQAEQTPRFGISRVSDNFVNVFGGDAFFFQHDGGIDCPADKITPLRIARFPGWAEWFFGQNHIKDRPVLAIRRSRTFSSPMLTVGGYWVAASSIEVLDHLIDVVEGCQGEIGIYGCHFFRNGLLARRTLDRADLEIGHIFEFGHVVGGTDHDPRTIVVGGRAEVCALFGNATIREGRIGDQNIDVTRGQRREAISRRSDGAEFDLGGVTKNCRSQDAAKIGIKTFESIVGGVEEAKAGDLRVNAANDHAPLLNC